MEEEKNKVGRPLKFRTKTELEQKIAEFKEYVKENKVPMTIERLGCFLECDRLTLINYGQKDEFFNTVEKIKHEIHAQKVERLNNGDGTAQGIIFDLKNNHGMKDKQELDHKHSGELSLGAAFERMTDTKKE